MAGVARTQFISNFTKHIMGSSSKPAKTTDRPIIQLVRKKGGGGAGGNQRSLDLNALCIESFSVKLSPTRIIRTGAILNINDKGEILLAGVVVGILNATQYKRITQCKEHGYGYMGVVTEKENQFYGHFKRRTL